MLLDLFSFAVGGFIGTIAGFAICAFMVMAKESDERMRIK